MIEIRHLRKTYQDTVALDGLDLVVESGDLFGLIGPNGAGKTTTIKILATLLRPDSGGVSIGGADIATDATRVRSMIGYVPDSFGIYDEMKVHEYLDFFGAAYGLSSSTRRRVIGDVLELTDLAEKREALIQALSRGMQQRLSLARALIHDPKVLLLDEPASGLDPRGRVEFRSLLRELRDMGKTILISSHILAELNEVCNKVAILERGRLLCSGTVEDVTRQIRPVRSVRVRVQGDAEAARQCLLANGIPGTRVETDELAIDLPEPDFDLGKISTLLVRSGFPVTRMVEASASLEDLFMQITEGKVQ